MRENNSINVDKNVIRYICHNDETEQLRQQSTEVRHYGTAPPASHSYTVEISPSRQQIWPQMLSIHVSILALVIAASGPLARGYPTYY